MSTATKWKQRGVEVMDKITLVGYHISLKGGNKVKEHKVRSHLKLRETKDSSLTKKKSPIPWPDKEGGINDFFEGQKDHC